MSVQSTAANRSWLDRALSLFTEMKAGEASSALLMAANVFYLLAFDSVLKIVRDALILSESGAVVANCASAGPALLLLVFVPASSAFASRVNRVRLVCSVTLFFASYLLLFCLGRDLLQAVMVFAGVYLAFDIKAYAMVNLVLVAIWLAVVFAIVREHKKLVPADVVKDAA